MKVSYSVFYNSKIDFVKNDNYKGSKLDEEVELVDNELKEKSSAKNIEDFILEIFLKILLKINS